MFLPLSGLTTPMAAPIVASLTRNPSLPLLLNTDRSLGDSPLEESPRPKHSICSTSRDLMRWNFPQMEVVLVEVEEEEEEVVVAEEEVLA